jgi:hypothetical protein
MATVVPKRESVTAIGGDDSTVLFAWTDATVNGNAEDRRLKSADVDGTPIEWAQYSDRCVQAVGTWGGATLSIEGSNDGTNWATLSKAATGTDLTFTANGLEQIIETPRYVRPKLTTAGVGATISVYFLLRRNNPLRT